MNIILHIFVGIFSAAPAVGTESWHAFGSENFADPCKPESREETLYYLVAILRLPSSGGSNAGGSGDSALNLYESAFTWNHVFAFAILIALVFIET